MQVTNVLDYGAFVQLPGFDKQGKQRLLLSLMCAGLVHITEISENRIGNVKDIMSQEGIVWVKVISLGVR